MNGYDIEFKREYLFDDENDDMAIFYDILIDEKERKEKLIANIGLDEIDLLIDLEGYEYRWKN